MKFNLRNLCITAAASLLFAGAANASTINTVSAYSSGWSPFGEPNTATYGQTFTVGAENRLDSFSLWLNGSPGAPVDFAAYVYQWDGNSATGPSLFASSAQQFLGSQSPQEFSFSTGGVELQSGSQYVAFLNASNYFNGVYGTASMPHAGSWGSDAYTGGSFVYYNNGSDFSALTSHNWDYYNGIDDVWFSASFSEPVPEPGTIMLLGAGFLGLAIYGKRRKS